MVKSGVVGLKYGDLLAFSATDGAKVTASGLPAGITLVRLDDGGRGATALPGGTDGRAVSPLTAAWGFTGFTTKAGTYLVTVKATLNGKTVTQRLALKVEGLPVWAKGTYNGYVTGADCATNGLATVTVSAVGKISGKFYEGGTNWTLTAASYTGYDPDASNYTAAVTAKYSWNVKSGKKTVTKSVSRTFTLTVAPVPVVPDVPDVPIRGIATLVETGGSQPPVTEIEAYQNLWGSTYKEVGKALFSTKSGKKTLAYKTFTGDIYTNETGACYFKDSKGGRLGEAALPGLTYFAALSLKITTAGAVTATLTYDTGKLSKGKVVYYKPTCTTVVIPTSAADAETFSGRVPLFLPPSAANNFPGLCVDLPYPFE